MDRREILRKYNDAIKLDYALGEKNLAHFFKAAWTVLEPGTPLKWNWHHELICEYLTAFYAGDIKRLIINVAPRSTKSLLCTVVGPDWKWLTAPSKRFVFGSYAEDLARDHSILRRNLIESPWFQEGYSSKFTIAQDRNTQTVFANGHTGTMRAAGMHGSITGKGGDYVIIDDPHNPKGAESDAERERTVQDFDLAWTSRLNDKKTGGILVVMQRLHDQDLTGHLLEKDIGYEHVKIPTVCEERCVVHFPLSGREMVREEGDLMHAERDGPEEIAQAKKDLGMYGFSGQHQQDPTPRTGGLIKAKDLRFYTEYPAVETKIIVADLTYEEQEQNDYTVVQCWGRIRSDIYLLDQIRAQMGFKKQVAALLEMRARHPDAISIKIEKKANGAAVIETLKGEVMGLVDVSPRTSKFVRLEVCQPTFESGNVWFPDPDIAPWITTNVTEVLKFMKTKHDDTVDTTTMAIDHFRGSKAAFDMLAALVK